MKSNAAGAPPIDGAKRKTCGLRTDLFLLFGDIFVGLPPGAKPVNVDLIAANGDIAWVDWHQTPRGIVGTVSTRKA